MIDPWVWLYSTILFSFYLFTKSTTSVIQTLGFWLKKKRMMLYNYTHWSTTRKLSLVKGLKTIHVCIPANFFWDIIVRFLSWECWDFWRRHDHFRWFPKKSEFFPRRPKSAEGEVIEKTLIHKIRDREDGIVFYSFYTWFSFLTWVWVNIFLEIVSSKTATTHIFQSGVRNWPASVSRREMEVFNPQAWELAGICVQKILKLGSGLTFCSTDFTPLNSVT